MPKKANQTKSKVLAGWNDVKITQSKHTDDQ